MDITQIKSPQAQPDVGLKVVKGDIDLSVQPERSESVVDKITQQQQEAVEQKSQTEETRTQMEERLTKQVSKMNEYVQSIQRDLKFTVDDNSGEVVVKVFNASTNELVRQFPSEEALKLSERIKESMENSSGLILKVEV